MTTSHKSSATPPREAREAIEGYIEDSNTRQCPWRAYSEMRMAAPIYRSEFGIWVITGYDQACRLMRDPRVGRRDAAMMELNLGTEGAPEYQRARNVFWGISLINQDEPEHTRLRKLVRHVFLPNAIEGWRPRIEDVARSLVDKIVDKPEFDVVTELAFPLPEIIICDIVNVDHSDHGLWSQWSKTVGLANFGLGEPDAERRRKVDEALLKYYNYVRDLLDRRRASPGNDLMSQLIQTEEDGERLTDDEIISMFEILILAGHETTAQFISNCVHMLLTNHELFKNLRAEPDRVSVAVEEFLRMVGTAHLMNMRYAREDVEIDGITIPKGDKISIVIAAANRDPAVFAEPETGSFDRRNLRQHIAFGFDRHFCLGANLARLETQIMLREIVTRLPDLELVEEPFWEGYATRGPRSLLVRRASPA